MNTGWLSRNAQPLGNTAILLIAGIGLFTAHFLFTRVPVQQHLKRTTATHQHVFIALSREGLEAARGLVSPCASAEPLAAHDCPVANNLRGMINSMLNSGKSVEQVRDYLFKTFGSKIEG